MGVIGCQRRRNRWGGNNDNWNDGDLVTNLVMVDKVEVVMLVYKH